MNGTVLADTGPIVALLNARDQHHAWAREKFSQLRPPLLTCEPVLTEATLLLAEDAGDATPVLGLVRKGVLQVAFSVEDELDSLEHLMRRYANVPMSLAGASLVRMSETRPHATVFTMDSDFRIYRRNGRLVIPVLMPPGR